MTKFRAIVSMTFDDDDLIEFAESLDIPLGQIDPHETVNGALDNLPFGSHWVEQFFEDGKPTITHLTNGITVHISPHEDS